MKQYKVAIVVPKVHNKSTCYCFAWYMTYVLFREGQQHPQANSKQINPPTHPLNLASAIYKFHLYIIGNFQDAIHLGQRVRMRS